MHKHNLTIAIDGPSGAGKSTIGKLLAKNLGYIYIDTGALYRASALEAQRRNISYDNKKALQGMFKEMEIKFINQDQRQHVLLNGQDITDEIRTPEISKKASDISALPEVREGLLSLQRELGRNGAVVLDGRDIGTVVFPNADKKFYLDASIEERSKRRYLELQGKKLQVKLKDITEDMRQRDHNDSTRKIAPLKKADDAIYINSTAMSIEEVVEFMMRHIKSS